MITEFSKIRKRSGRVVPFEQDKIAKAISLAGKATGEFNLDVAKHLAAIVTHKAVCLLEDVPTVEQIQDVVVDVLLDSPYRESAKNYILYRDQHAQLRELTDRNSISLIDSYIDRDSWEVKENSNMSYSLQGLNIYTAGEATKRYWLRKFYKPSIRKAYTECAMHIHDLSVLGSYTYFGKECIIAKYKGSLLLLSFSQLYDVVETLEDNPKPGVFTKYPEDLVVLDKEGWTKVTRLTRKTKDKDMYFVKNRGGRSVIVTEDHPVITQDGNRAASEVTTDDFTYTVDLTKLLGSDSIFTEDSIDLLSELKKRNITDIRGTGLYFNGKKLSELFTEEEFPSTDGVISTCSQGIGRTIPLTEDFGYFVGAVLAEGYLSYDTGNKITLTQRDKLWLEKVNSYSIKTLGIAGIITQRDNDYELSFYNGLLKLLFESVFRIGNCLCDITLPVNILSYNKDFVLGVLGGIIDGDSSIITEKTISFSCFYSRSLLEQCCAILSLLGFTPKDENLEYVGPTRIYKGRIIAQGDHLYSLSFRNAASVDIPSFKYKEALVSKKAWMDEDRAAWHKIITVSKTDFPDEYIYDITTESHTLVVNGMWNHNCVGWDLQDLLQSGYRGVAIKPESKPAKHFRTALGQIVNFFFTLQGEAAGAQAFSNFDTLLAPFIAYDNLDYIAVKQAMQEFVFNMNVPTRSGFQAPFTNLTMDLIPPAHLANKRVVIGGEFKDRKYCEFQSEMNMLNRAFLEVMTEGDMHERVLTFPIPTYNITKDFDWDNPLLDFLWDVTAKYGIPYFANFVNSDMSPDDARSMCCRLRLDLRKLEHRGGGLFGANPLTGCYDDKTEIMTDAGWKYFSELSYDDKVFTLSENDDIELHKPKNIFTYDWDGELYSFKAKSLDLLVTPNHRMLCDHVPDGKRTFLTAETFDANNYRIPKQGKWKGVNREYFTLPAIENRVPMDIPMNTWLKFYGLFLSEGSFDNKKIAQRHGYRVFISQSKEENLQIITDVLDALPFNYRKESASYIICNKQLWSYLRQFGKQPYRFITTDIKELCNSQLKILFDYMMVGDGHIREPKSSNHSSQLTYYTVSSRLADDLQEVIMKLGMLGTKVGRDRSKHVSYIRGRRINTSRICYTVSIQQSKHYRIRKDNITKEYYKGKVYCCEVENNSVMVRRNGKVTWCGNSIGVVTINLPQIGFLSETKEEFFTRLIELMDMAKESLEVKRKVIEQLTENNLYPYSKFYLRSVKERHGNYWQNHFSTIGLVGMHEACLNLLGVGIETEEGGAFALDVLNFMREKLTEYQEETGNLYNLEATPAEGTSYRLAKSDVKKFPGIITAGTPDSPFYTNSSQLPVDCTDDLFTALDKQDLLQAAYTGGTVQHVFLGEAAPDNTVVKNFVRKVCEGYQIPYFTLSPTFSICPNHGYLKGEQLACPECGETAEVYSRVVGYLRPVSQWNDGKQKEFELRSTFKL